ncbi:MFS transporter [Vreelandella neptunia]|uniref:MFS transporter n=1 Tax=Vreelandella neptunia TaxID=115551 RepID=A0ABS9S6V3_9GAMM|nr:MFS transporter [Halomonas neptunia]MCH4811846.1 MFS transporter [Halomonas neptunia]
MTTSEIGSLNRDRDETEQSDRLPITALLALALAGFVTILTEALPAGLLPQIGAGLEVSESLAGQLVTVYAIGSLLAAIPLVAATQGVRRRPLLLAAIIGFAVANTITTLSTSYLLTIAARFLAGVAAGLLWALLAGYAARMVPEHLKGRAIAIAMVGTPLALSLGVPAGTFLGTLVGWRACFGIMSVLALILVVWVRLKVPDFAGQSTGKRLSLSQVFMLPGIRSVLFVVLAFILAHNILYTYIAPFLANAHLAERTDLVLLVFGIAALVGIWVIGILIDRYLRVLTLASTALFGLAALALGVAGGRLWRSGCLGSVIWRLSNAVSNSTRQGGWGGRGYRAVHAGDSLELGHCWRWHYWRSTAGSLWYRFIFARTADTAYSNTVGGVGCTAAWISKLITLNGFLANCCRRRRLAQISERLRLLTKHLLPVTLNRPTPVYSVGTPHWGCSGCRDAHSPASLQSTA